MGAVEERIRALGFSLPSEAAPVANYVPAVVVESAGLVFTSGHVARHPDGSFIAGKLGAGLSVEDGYEAARAVALSLLGTMKAKIGDLDRIERVVKLLCMVNSDPDFVEQPAVANGASDVLIEILGDKGRHARSAVGVAALPGNVCVEIEMTVQVSA